MGLLGAIGDAVGDIGGAIVDVADAAAEGVAHVADTASDVVGGAATVVNTATGGWAEKAVELVDDVVLDSVDKMTGGLVDIDYDDGVFTAKAGVEGIAHAGAEISQSGVRVESNSLLHDQGIGFTDDGLDLTVKAGVEGVSQHLPFGGLGLDLDTDGDIEAETEFKGTVPTPYGLVSGQGSAGVHQTDEGFVGYLDAKGQIILPDGDVVAGNVGVAYAENDQGSQLGVDVGASYTSVGGYTIGGQLGYDRLETADGTVVEGLEVAATAGVAGMTHTVGHQSVSVQPGANGLPGQPAAQPPVGAPGAGSGAGSAEATIGLQVGPPAFNQPGASAPVGGQQFDAPGPAPTVAPGMAPQPEPAAPVFEPQPQTELVETVAIADTVEASVDSFFTDL